MIGRGQSASGLNAVKVSHALIGSVMINSATVANIDDRRSHVPVGRRALIFLTSLRGAAHTATTESSISKRHSASVSRLKKQ